MRSPYFTACQAIHSDIEGPNISRTFIEGLGRNKSNDACKIVVLGTRPSLVGTYVWRQFDLKLKKNPLETEFQIVI